MSQTDRKRVLVTGAATGVGRAAALKFAEHQFDVLVNYLGPEQEQAEETAEEVRAQGVACWLYRCDVSDDAQVRELAGFAESHFERLDAVVNCAGTTEFVEHADLEGMTEAMWDRILAVNTKGPFFVIRACLPLLRRASQAAIVNVSSVAGISGQGSSIAYCASKGALNSITKSLAVALAPQVRVNAVCPGPIDSAWLRRGMTEEEIRDRLQVLPIPRLISPEQVAQTIFYLAVESEMTTGQLLVVNGGASI